MSYIDSVARLLAIENLTIERVPAETASFNLEQRILRIPLWKELTENTEQLMVVHEVGHAKYTPTENWKTNAQSDKYFIYYMNVCEDARIEKLMKREYPGAKKPMLEGYADLHKRDFFGVKKMKLQDVNKKSLINKLNLHMKLGNLFGVEFTDEEKPFVERAEKLETFEEAVQLAKDIYKFSKFKAEQMADDMLAKAGKGKPQKGQGSEKGEGSGDGQGDEDGEGDGKGQGKDEKNGKGKGEDGTGKGKGKDQDKGGSGTNSGNKPGDEDCDCESDQSGLKGGHGGSVTAKEDLDALKKMIDDYMAVDTEEAFRKNMSGQVDKTTKYVYKNLNLNYTRNPIIDYKTVLAETKGVDARVATNNDIKEFKRDSDQVVGYLIKEFELRKSAELNKRAVVSKTGQLDMRKIFAYQLKDDLFRRVTQLPQGKNHGMVFMVDWSGSMGQTIHKTLLQVLNLTSFCRRMQIPFRVFAFTDRYRNQYGVTGNKVQPNKNKRLSDANTLSTNQGSFSLLELMSSDMSNNEYTTMFNRLYCTSDFTSGSYSLGGTPLNHSLLYMLEYLPAFREKYNLEKVTFIPLTDGEGTCTDWSSGYPDSYSRYGSTYTNNQKTFVRDLDTKKEYHIGNGSAEQTAAILRIIKDKCNVKIIGFHLTASNGARQAIQAHCSRAPKANEEAKIAEDFQRDGVHLLKGSAHDMMFLVDMGKLGISYADVTKGIDSDDTAASTANQLVKNFNRVLKSRILLDKFIETMA